MHTMISYDWYLKKCSLPPTLLPKGGNAFIKFLAILKQLYVINVTNSVIFKNKEITYMLFLCLIFIFFLFSNSNVGMPHGQSLDLLCLLSALTLHVISFNPIALIMSIFQNELGYATVTTPIFQETKTTRLISCSWYVTMSQLEVMLYVLILGPDRWSSHYLGKLQ